ncbi:hypothetical protein NQZ68_040261 [Dissostichus eleginoides]|nr:hypothetical protein NQZ68_040261 [Dissostichus eleginoides]
MKRVQTGNISNTPQRHYVPCVDVPWSGSHGELVEEQRAGESLKGRMESVLPGGEVKSHAQGYSLQKNVRLGNWVPQSFDGGGAEKTISMTGDTWLEQRCYLSPAARSHMAFMTLSKPAAGGFSP